MIYLLLLAWIVLWKLAIPSINGAAFLPHPIKWVPFVASGDAGASNPLEVIANVALFIPFGIYLRLVAPASRTWKLIAIFIGASVIFEITQQLLSIGTFDVTDVITNTSGGLLGLGILVLLRRRLGAKTHLILTRIAVVVTVVSIIAVAIYVASPLRYEDRQDVIVHRMGSSGGS